MKLTAEQKIRIVGFLALHPTVSHQDMADLFGVCRTTITGAVKDYGFYDTRGHRAWILDNVDMLLGEHCQDDDGVMSDNWGD